MMEPQNIRLIGGPRDGEKMTVPGSTYVYGTLVFEKLDHEAVRRAYLETGMDKPVVTQTVRYYRHTTFGDIWLHESLMPALADAIEDRMAFKGPKP